MGTVKKEDLLSEVVGSTPLSQATRGVKIEWEDPVVWRYNGQRAIKARCNNAQGYTAESVRGKLIPLVDTITLPEGYTKQWLGEHKASSEAMRYLFKNVPWAIVMIIVILIMLFKDFRKPTIIFLCLPLAAIGIVFGMLISGKDFGFVAIVGALGLIGMMIKNGVVLLDEITLQIEVSGFTGFVVFAFPAGNDGFFNDYPGDDSFAGRRLVRFSGRHYNGRIAGRYGDHFGVYTCIVCFILSHRKRR